MLLASLAAMLALGACGDDPFDRMPRRPPVPIQLTGIITPDSVDVSPRKLGAGPIVINLSNQTERSHTITLEGNGVFERVGPINPGDTATLQTALKPGRYQVRAGSEQAMPRGIEPEQLVIGRQRRTAEDELVLP